MLSPDDLTDIFESADMIGIHTFDMICLGICHHPPSSDPAPLYHHACFEDASKISE